ncbi:phycocyanobilin:ferredoxin oxidoreductase [Synechococcus sp. PCC 7502]|uniref:phycocyanobilin:ferredoxin oxidoreductase n=1 Tax=Synechococcus sp. PCC 7502 TaxID=1173263 RepID=UPI00029FE82E|nr:phycocyanobilin:ferredoxin oxidoreductase [Synechococcus sp. PCC 7502]AFY72840.1 phycocyanobilin:ferredoxin oxidoreductase [Synechococcus sp. PCC 7502]
MENSNFHPLIIQLSDRIEAIWHQYLNISDYEMPADLGYVEGKLEGERLTIQNRCYQAPQFRKLHIELAQVGSNLDILHCVMYPQFNYPLPIFGADLIGGKAGISAAIVDISPTVTIPDTISEPIRAWQASQPQFSQPRELPAWGKNIFSEFCIFVRPQGQLEENLFLQTLEKYCTQVCTVASELESVSEEIKTIIQDRHRHYCQQQQQNDKTRRILEKAFGKEWADRYMNTVLFDVV